MEIDADDIQASMVFSNKLTFRTLPFLVFFTKLLFCNMFYDLSDMHLNALATVGVAKQT